MYKNQRLLALRTNMSPDSLERLLGAHEVISFGIIETLLFRKCWLPEDVFRFLERRHDQAGFTEARLKADWLARRRGKTETESEVTLEKIYGVLSELLPGLAVTPEDEIEAERSFLARDPATCLLLDAARHRGKRVIGVSDSYLPRELIETILRAQNIKLDALYCSSDRGSRGSDSQDGNLFMRVARAEAVTPAAMVHFGADPQGDIESARASGLSTVRIKPLREVLTLAAPPFIGAEPASHATNLTAALTIGQTAARAPFIAADETPLYTFGYAMGGPLLAGFCRFLLEQATKDGVDRLILPVPAGQIVGQALDIIAPAGIDWSLSASDEDRENAAGKLASVAIGRGPSPQAGHSRNNAAISYALGSRGQRDQEREAAAFLFGGGEPGWAEPVLSQGWNIVELLFTGLSGPAARHPAGTPEGPADLALDAARRGALDFVRDIVWAWSFLDSEELADLSRRSFTRLIAAPTVAEKDALADISTIPNWPSDGPVKLVTPPPASSYLAQMEQGKLIKDLVALLPLDLRKLAQDDELATLDWRREFFANPFAISRWSSIRRYQRRTGRRRTKKGPFMNELPPAAQAIRIFVPFINEAMVERFFRKNPYLDGVDVSLIDNRGVNSGISEIYNSVIASSLDQDLWLLFVHEDFEIRGPLFDLTDLPRNAVYGTFGVRMSGHSPIGVGRHTCSRKDGSEAVKLGAKIETPTWVDTLDCMAIMLHTSMLRKHPGLRFDQNLSFDLYCEEFCLNAQENFGIPVMVLPLAFQHYSHGKITERYFRGLEHLARRYPDSAMPGSCSFVGGQAERLAANFTYLIKANEHLR